MAHCSRLNTGARISLVLKRKRDGAPLVLANEGAGDVLPLGVWY